MAAFFTTWVSPILTLVKVNHKGLENDLVGSSSQFCREKHEAFLQKQPPAVFCTKKVFLKISKIPQEYSCARTSLLIKFQVAWNFIKKEALSQVLSCEFSEIFKNTFFTEHVWSAASLLMYMKAEYNRYLCNYENDLVTRITRRI